MCKQQRCTNMNDKKKVILPCKINTNLGIECWTFYKMAIIQTLPEHMNWLSSHMNIFCGELGEGVYFGKDNRPHDSAYYSDILDIEEIDIYSVAPNKIAERIKHELNNDFYYVVFLRNEEGFSHEIFIYGYDDSNHSFNTVAIGENGHFCETLISYETVIEQYCNNYEYLKLNPDQYYCKSNFGYVMYRMKPNTKYIRKNYAVEYFDKLYYEVYGTRTDLCYSDDYNQYLTPCSFYTGVTCLIRVNEKINALANSSDQERKNIELYIVKNNLFKLYEYRLLLNNSMKWYEEQWRIDDPNILSLHNEYSSCCYDMERTCMMLLKYIYTNDQDLLYRIQDELMLQYAKERKILCEYVNVIREFYNSQVLSKKFE